MNTRYVTLEELEIGHQQVEAEVECLVDYGEPPTFYYDGSACPGSGPSLEYLSVAGLAVLNADGEDVYAGVSDPDWRALAERSVDGWIRGRRSRIEEQLLDELLSR